MVISIRYPTNGSFSLADLEGDFNNAFDRSRALRYERDAPETFGKYADWINQQGGGQPMSLASLGAPAGQVTRAPLDTVADPASARVAQAHATAGGQPSVGEMTSYIAKAAQARGIDPGVAIRVARSEGLAPGVWQSQLGKNGRREPSYGPFQLLVGGGDTGYPTGLGNAFVEQTGLSPTDPANWQKTVDFALDNASKSGWGAWYGAGKAGIGNWQGINQGAAPPAPQQALEGLAVGESMQMPPAQVADAGGGNGGNMPATLLPPGDVMRKLFANPNTRDFAIGLAQAAQKVRANANDPMAGLEYKAAALNLIKAQRGLDNEGVPAGYRRSANGLEAIPGGPADPDNPLNVRKTTPANGITVSPDGTVSIGGNQKLTEGQSKDVTYYTSGTDANVTLSGLESQLTDWTQQNAGMIPLGLGNYLRDPKFQQAKVAADRFLASILRKETGAAVTEKEFEYYGGMFLPVPGDGPETLQLKRRMREVALEGIRAGMGTAEAIGTAMGERVGGTPGELTPRPDAPAGPPVGTVEDGYRYKGGDVSNPDSWEPVQ